MLGPLEVRRGAEVLAVPAPKQRALLALLLMHRNRVVTSDQIIEELWGDDPPRGGARTLRFHVSKLRDALEPDRSSGQATAIKTQPPGYLLEVGEGQLDVLDVEAALAEARAVLAADPERASDLLQGALDLWRGPALADLRYEEFAAAEVRLLDDLRLVVHEERIEADLAIGRANLVVGELEALIVEEPLRERLRGQLMRALYATGRHAEAVRQYRTAEEALAELGLEPGPELKQLEEQILLHDPSLRATAAPAASPPVPTRLPVELSSFIGRSTEVAQVRNLAAASRLLTLTGAGGCGKTRLAIEVAQASVDEGGGGAALVLLGGVSDSTADGIAEAALDQLGLAGGGTDPLGALCRALQDREVLLVLDNCEHLVDAVGEVVAAVLGRCPDVRILATSRQPLGLSGEATYRVPSMSLPATGSGIAGVLDSDAGRLLVERARAADSSFDPDDGFAEVLTDICVRLDGIPLAIELAAARFRHLTPEEVAARLEDRFRLLTDGGSQVLARQRTLEATVTWSYELLAPTEQLAFARLAVFRGGCTVASAERVIVGGAIDRADVVDLLAGLVDRSLLQVERGAGGRSRYRMLETLREYALARLDERRETDQLYSALADYLVDLVEDAEARLRGPDEASWLAQLDAEVDNIRSAVLACLAAGRADIVQRMLGALKLFLVARPAVARAARPWLTEALAAPAALPPALRARAFSAAGALAWAVGDLNAAEHLHGHALQVARRGDAAEWSFRALNDLGLVALDRGDRAAAKERFAESVDAARAADSPRDLGTALAFLAQVEEPGRQRELLTESLELQRAVGRVSGVAHVTAGLAWLAFHRLDLGEAATRFAESAAEWDRLGNDEAVAIARCGQADAAGRLAAEADEARWLDEALARAERAESRHAAALCRYRLGDLARRGGDFERAAELLAAAGAAWADRGSSPGSAMVFGYRAALAAATGQEDDADRLAARCAAAWADLNRPDGVAWAHLGPPAGGRPRLRDGLVALRAALAAPIPIDGWSSPETCLAGLAGTALLGVAAGAEPDLAARLLGAVGVLAEPPLGAWAERIDGIAASAGDRLGDGYAAAVDEGRAWTTVEAVDASLAGLG